MQINTAPTQMPTDEQIRRDDILAAAEADRAWIKSTRDAAGSSRSNLPSLRRAVQLLRSADTGPLTPYLLEAKRLGNQLGFPVDLQEITTLDELQVYLGDQLMSRVQETKGAVSNKEMDLFEKFSASMGKTREGNLAILDFQIAKAERDIQLSSMIRDMRKAGKTSGQIRNAVEDFIDQNDLSGLLALPEKADTKAPTGLTPEQRARKAELAERYKSIITGD